MEVRGHHVVTCLLLLVLARGQEEGRAPPTIQKPEVSAQQFESEDSVVTLVCKADGTPPPAYSWYFKDNLVTSLNPPGDKVSFDKQTGLLTIQGVTSEQTGPYSCRASNLITSTVTATAVSPKIDIQLSYIGAWPVETRPPVTATEGRYLAMYCDNSQPAFSGPTTYKWYRRADTNNVVPTSDRIFVDSNGTLHFTTVLMEDDKDNKDYSCALSNADSGKIVLGSRVNLQISSSYSGKIVLGSRVNLQISSSSTPTIPPKLQYSTANLGSEALTFIRGTTARLECFFSGNPPPSVTWIDNGGEDIVPGKHFGTESSGRVLLIHNVDEIDDTTFYCKGTDGQSFDQGTLKVNITSPPIWVKPLQSQTVIQGLTAVFHCDTRSMSHERDPDQPEWFKNGVSMKRGYDPTKHRFSNSNRTMEVMNLDKEKDIACYQCVVKNSVGETFGDGCLNVILPIEILTQPSPRQVVSKGDLVNLTVVATTDPLLTLNYEWLFKGQNYSQKQSPPFVTYNMESKLAYINTSTLKDDQMANISGVYRRRIFHAFQEVFVDVEVVLASEVGPAVAGFPYWIIGLILALLLLIIIIIICCCVICRRKMQEGDYPVDKKETAAGLDPEKEVKEGGFPDLSRASDPYQKPKPGQLDMDGQSIGDDESFGSAEYGAEQSAFNEDGSFIGVYKGKDNPAFQPNPKTPKEKEKEIPLEQDIDGYNNAPPTYSPRELSSNNNYGYEPDADRGYSNRDYYPPGQGMNDYNDHGFKPARNSYANDRPPRSSYGNQPAPRARENPAFSAGESSV
ncbi:neurofascin-like [Babylonia areolata]|uniref:neurofascin-like n=1 Tax=Babylonia areolata TaxID=304850 RepID=UPI003FD2C610